MSPSCTEIVCALGCAKQLIGRSHLCDFPAEIRALPACTGPSSSDLDVTKIAALEPDLILHETDSPVVLPSLELPALLSLTTTRIIDLWSNIQKIADALDVGDQGRELISPLKGRVVDILAKTCAFEQRPTVACISAVEPLTVAGFWIPEWVEFAGGLDLAAQPGKPGPVLDWDILSRQDPQYIVFMLSGLDIARTRSALGVLDEVPQWRGLRAVQSGKVFVTDANQFFSRPGPRLIDSLEFLAEILYQKKFQYNGQGKAWQKW